MCPSDWLARELRRETKAFDTLIDIVSDLIKEVSKG
jgi:hypothetical protein